MFSDGGELTSDQINRGFHKISTTQECHCCQLYFSFPIWVFHIRTEMPILAFSSLLCEKSEAMRGLSSIPTGGNIL